MSLCQQRDEVMFEDREVGDESSSAITQLVRDNAIELLDLGWWRNYLKLLGTDIGPHLIDIGLPCIEVSGGVLKAH